MDPPCRYLDVHLRQGRPGGFLARPRQSVASTTVLCQPGIVDALLVLVVPLCYPLGKPNSSRFKESQRPWPMMRWSSSSISSSFPAATISTVSATSAADGVGSPEGWLWTATMAVACWRTASRKTSLFRRKRAPRKRVRRDNGSGRQVQRARIFLDHELAGAVNREN